MMDTVLVQQLQSGDVFDDSLPGAQPDRDRVFRVVTLRKNTVIAENVAGVRMSFSMNHRTKAGTTDLWNQLRNALPAGRLGDEARKASPAQPAKPEAGAQEDVA